MISAWATLSTGGSKNSTCEIALKKTLPQLDGSQLDMLDS